MAELTALERYRQRKAAGTPGVNPPEAEKVLETQTTPETEARPAVPASEPAAAAQAVESTAQLPAAGVGEPKQKRARRAASNTAAAPAVESAEPSDEILAAIQLLVAALPLGTSLTIAGNRR